MVLLYFQNYIYGLSYIWCFVHFGDVCSLNHAFESNMKYITHNLFPKMNKKKFPS